MSNDEWVNKDVRVPEGSYLATSHETPGAERALLFDRESGNNLGPAELRDPETESDPDKAYRDLILLAVGAAVTLVAVKAPEMKRGLDEKVLPAIRAKWTTFRSRKSDSPAPETEDEPSNTEIRPHLALVKDEESAA
jgi:hypothetical protein